MCSEGSFFDAVFILLKILAVGHMGEFGTQLKFLFRGHTHPQFITTYPFNPTARQSPHREPSQFSLFGTGRDAEVRV